MAVTEPFRARGHRVILHGEVLAPGAKDEAVCYAAMMHEAVPIMVDRDMRQPARRSGNVDESNRFARLRLIDVCSNEVLAAKHIEHTMSFIENDGSVVCAKAARRLGLEIGAHYHRTFR